MNCRGDDGIDAKRSRPSIGNTRYKCHAKKERVLLVGTRSADYIRASGHNGRTQRPYTWLHPTRSLNCQIFLLHRGRRPYMALRGDAIGTDWSAPLMVDSFRRQF